MRTNVKFGSIAMMLLAVAGFTGCQDQKDIPMVNDGISLALAPMSRASDELPFLQGADLSYVNKSTVSHRTATMI